jgi:hypothetical protein
MSLLVGGSGVPGDVGPREEAKRGGDPPAVAAMLRLGEGARGSGDVVALIWVAFDSMVVFAGDAGEGAAMRLGLIPRVTGDVGILVGEASPGDRGDPGVIRNAFPGDNGVVVVSAAGAGAKATAAMDLVGGDRCWTGGAAVGSGVPIACFLALPPPVVQDCGLDGPDGAAARFKVLVVSAPILVVCAVCGCGCRCMRGYACASGQ